MTNNSPKHILIVEDERDLADLLADYLAAAGFTCTSLQRGDEVAQWLQHNHADALLLDLMLPGLDGIEVCKQLRSDSSPQRDLPILMTTARVEEIDRLLGLELGADDYICKPYSPREVVARVKTVLRRSPPSEPSQASTGTIELLPERCQVTINHHTIELTNTETQLLALLMGEPGRIYSRDQIMDNIYRDYRIVSERTIDSHVKKLRKKLDAVAPEYNCVQSVYGAGYKFTPPSTDIG